MTSKYIQTKKCFITELYCYMVAVLVKTF